MTFTISDDFNEVGLSRPEFTAEKRRRKTEINRSKEGKASRKVRDGLWLKDVSNLY